MDYKAAFLNTDYIVVNSNINVIINADCYNSETDKLLNGATTWAFITAHNPLPQILSEKENKKRNDLLKKEVQKLGLTTYNGYGIAKDNSWREDSFFIVGISKKDAVSLGKKFGQMAIIYGFKKSKAKLILIH